MALTQRITHGITLQEGGGTQHTFSWVESQSAGREVNFSDTIADSVTDQQGDWTCDISELKSFVMWSDKALLVETNNGTTPGDTFTLIANQPVYWTPGATSDATPSATVGIINPLTVDVTALFSTNTSGSTATLNVRSIQDPTP